MDIVFVGQPLTATSVRGDFSEKAVYRRYHNNLNLGYTAAASRKVELTKNLKLIKIKYRSTRGVLFANQN
jgi:hypothetical protein